MTATVHVLHGDAVTFVQAADAMLDRRDLAATTARAYAATFRQVGCDLGEVALVAIDQAQLVAVLAGRWGVAAPATYNRHRAALSSLFEWAAGRGWIADNPVRDVERRRVRRTRTQEARQRPIPTNVLEAVWSDRSHPIRERTLWRMLYETAARANEVLELNVADLDLRERSAVVTSKGGNVDRVFWATGTARLLPHLLDGRTSGPVFLSARRPTRPMPTVDVDPTTGRARLSYRQAEHLWKAASYGATLHQLRHSALTHLAEAGVDAALLKAKSRHASIRSLERYVNPSADAVKALTDRHDPVRRRGGGP